MATVRSRKLAEAAQEANLSKGAFLATMSHEIRTPLNSIIGFSELLDGTPLSDDQGEDLATIRRSADILLDLINSILDLSKIEAGKMHLEVTPVHINETIHEVISLFKLHAERKGVSLLLEVEPSVPEIVYTDATRLYQVLNNLISNALKFTDKGSITVRAWGENSGDGERFHMSVRDTGIGIARDKLDDVFVAFTQADSSTTRKYGGTGLSLAICKRLVEMLGGDISVESIEGKGSTFSFSFRNLSDVYEGRDAVATEDAASTGFDLDGTMNVLVAEDDPTNYSMTSKLLRRLNITPDWAKNGRQAVTMAREKEYDMILMDLQMPEMDGYSAAREILEASGDTDKPYIAALTANALGESREACKEAGMKDFLAKPVSGEDIKAALIRYKKSTQAEV